MIRCIANGFACACVVCIAFQSLFLIPNTIAGMDVSESLTTVWRTLVLMGLAVLIGSTERIATAGHAKQNARHIPTPKFLDTLS